jgi:Family of unknown function (DUF5677)
MKKSKAQKRQSSRTYLYKMEQILGFLQAACKKRISALNEPEFTAASLAKTTDEYMCNVLSLVKNGHINQAKVFLRLAFESNCTLNYLMKNQDEIQYYKDYSLLVSYKDLLLMLKYGFLSYDSLSNDGSMSLKDTVDKVKASIIESGVLEKVGRVENCLELENVDSLATIKTTFKSIYVLKDCLVKDPFFGAMDSTYHAMYNVPSQVIHSHWNSSFDNLLGKDGIYDEAFICRFLATSANWLGYAMNTAGLLSAADFGNLTRIVLDLMNTIRIEEGQRPLTIEDITTMAMGGGSSG